MKKNFIMLGIVAALVLVLALFGNIQSVDEYYMTHMEDIKSGDATVSISIDCSSILDNWDQLDDQLKDEKYVPADGMILPESTYVLRKGDTVFDILKRVCRYKQIQMEYTGTKVGGYSSAYIEGIHYLYEKNCGPLSGWMYKVNGEFASVGCDSYKLKDGDRIEWVYTCNLGKDVGQEEMS